MYIFWFCYQSEEYSKITKNLAKQEFINGTLKYGLLETFYIKKLIEHLLCTRRFI